MTDVFSIAVQNVAVALLLALLVWGLTRVLKNPPVAHLLWVLVLAKLVTPPVVHLDLWKWAPAPGQRGEPASDTPSAVPQAIVEGSQHSIPPSSNIAGGDAEPDRAANGSPNNAAEGDAQPPIHARLGDTIVAAWSTIRPILMWIWVGGACLVGILVGIRIVRFQRVLGGTLPASERLQSVANELSDRMGLRRSLNVRVVDAAVAPLLWWVGRRPTVVLPLRLLGALDEQQTAMVLAHELAHLRRRDHLVRLLELVVSVLYWWNPLVWSVRRQLHAVEEQCCDAWVAWVYTNQSHGYAESLLKAAELSPHHPSLPVLASPFLHTYALKERIEMVLKNTSRRTASRRAAMGLVLLAAVVIPAGIQFGRTKSDAAGTAVSGQVTVGAVQRKAVTLTQRYVGQIDSYHHIEVRAPEAGYLGAITINEGQQVKDGDLMFQLRSRLGKEKLDAKNEDKVVSIKAPFNGMVGRLRDQQGSLVQQGETLTTLSDNSLMWVYFNVPEARYLEYKSANAEQHKDDPKIELVLANGNKFDQPGKLGAIAADFNSANGNIPFRADFPNPDGLLRHGETGTVLISQVQNDAIVVPQPATFEVLGKRYVYVVDKDGVAHQREISVQNETADNLFVVKKGVGVDDKIVVGGVRLVHGGDKVE